MSEGDRRDPMFPDTDHLRRWSADQYPDNPPDGLGFGMPPARRGAYMLGIGIGLGIVALILARFIFTLPGREPPLPPCRYNMQGRVNQPCVLSDETSKSYRAWQEKVREEQVRNLRKQHEDISKAMREYRNP